MAREKKGKGRAELSLEIEPPPSSDSEATRDASLVAAWGKRKTVTTKVPKRAQG